MEFEVIHPYDASVERVHAAKRTPEFWQRKYEALGQRQVEVLECAEQGALFRIRTRREVPVNVPSFAKKIIAPFNSLIQTDEWAPADGDQRQGSWTVEVIDRPIALRGIMRLVPRGPDSCHELIRGEVEVSVRLVGGMVARFLAGDTERGLAEEHRFTQQYLAGA